jgi:hypothetical protein
MHLDVSGTFWDNLIEDVLRHEETRPLTIIVINTDSLRGGPGWQRH